MQTFGLFWGDTHHNTYQYPEPRAQDPPLDVLLRDAGRHLDFYAGAYYTACCRHVPLLPGAAARHPDCRGIGLEGWKPPARIEREWREFQEITRALDAPGAFVVFPGYEWQGNGTSGDHNVVGRQEGFPVHRVDTVEALYERLRGGEFIAIPHHTGYQPGMRAQTWEACDERLSPFAEIYSKHGCSETDEEWVGLRRNVAMGPGAGGGTYADALAKGLHLGAICSTDNWSNVPGHFNEGLMACYARELTRESLWEAFLARRVYGVSGDRIALRFSVNDAPMGSRPRAAGPRCVRIAVRGEEALDRIEVLRGNRVWRTHCHQGTWQYPESAGRYKLRLEVGWGAKPGSLPIGDEDWQGALRLSSGRFTGANVYRTARDQGVPECDGACARFRLRSEQASVPAVERNACVFEFHAAPSGRMHIEVNGAVYDGDVASLCAAGRVLWDRESVLRRVGALTGLKRAECERDDLFYHVSPKVKLHRAVPEAAYAAELEMVDEEPLAGETHYRVRVEQRNGQRAWSSPIWVRPAQ